MEIVELMFEYNHLFESCSCYPFSHVLYVLLLFVSYPVLCILIKLVDLFTFEAYFYCHGLVVDVGCFQKLFILIVAL